MKRIGAIAVAALALLAATADGSCSASASAAWKAKCPSRTTGNRDFLPLTDMAANTINVDDSNLVDTYNQARLTALKLSGAVGSAAMDGMRKKSRSWYEASLRKIMTFLCVETSTDAQLQRCVNASSIEAERDASGACVVLSDEGNCHSKGMCERESNCKWDDALPSSKAPRKELFTAANVTSANKWMAKEYPTTFAPFLAPGIVFSVLTALTAVAFLVLRCVFNQCGGRNPSEKGYSRCDILIPSVVFLLCSAAVFICSFVTIAQNTNVSEGVTGVIHSLNVTLENIDIFASNIRAPLAEAEQQLASAKITVNAQVKDLGWVATDGAKLAQMLTDFGAYYQTRGPFPFSTCDRANNWCVVCPDTVCGAPVKDFVASTTSAYQASGALVATSLATMQQAFVNESDAIALTLKTATKEIGELANLTRSSKSVVDVIAATVDDYSFSRSALVLSVFLFGVFSSLVGAFAIFKGVCKKKTAWVHMLHVSWLVGVLVCILGFVLAASLLAVGALWYDSCNYMNILHSDISPYFPSGVSKIVNACFADTGILSPLQVEDALSFQCALSDQYAGVSSADFGAAQTLIKAYGTRISNYGLRDFGYDTNVWKDVRDKANAALDNAGVAGPTPFTKDNILKPWAVYGEASAGGNCSASNNVTADAQPICYMDAKCASSSVNSARAPCKESFAGAYYYQLAFAKVAVMLNEMRQDVLGDSGASFSGAWKYDTSLFDFAQDYFNRVETVRTQSVDYLMKGEVGRVLETVERARCTESCGWINISFNAVHEALCTDILGTTLAISLCVFFLCIFMIPLIVTGITLHKRLRGTKKGTYDELEKRLQQLESKQREEARAKRSATSPLNGDRKGGIDLFKFKKNLDSA